MEQDEKEFTADVLITAYGCEVHRKVVAGDKSEKVIAINERNGARLLSYLSICDQIRLQNHCAGRLKTEVITKIAGDHNKEDFAADLVNLIRQVIKTKAIAVTKSTGKRVQGAVAKVHAICGQLKGQPRKAVIAACVEAGINKGTAGVQYAAWSKANG